jgi:hypothetical protein
METRIIEWPSNAAWRPSAEDTTYFKAHPI